MLFLVCLYVCVRECLLHNNMRRYTSNQYSNIWGPLRECRSIRPGASGLPYYRTSICVRFGCTRLASCVDLKTKQKKLVCLYICVCKCLLPNNNHKTKHKNNTNCGSASQALPGYLITAPPSVCVPDVIGVLAVWIQN